jgi:hypothetical protein
MSPESYTRLFYHFLNRNYIFVFILDKRHHPIFIESDSGTTKFTRLSVGSPHEYPEKKHNIHMLTTPDYKTQHRAITNSHKSPYSEIKSEHVLK